MEKIKRKDVLNYVNSRIKESGVVDSFHDLKLFCKVEEISVTEQQIKKYLREKAIEDGVDLNISACDTGCVDLVNTNKNFIQRSADNLIREITISKYQFRREDLQYFNDLFRIYTSKCKQIGIIFSMIAGRRLVDADLMESLDIELTAEEVLISDVERLIVPLIRNYALALDTKLKAEKLDIYLSHIINKESMLKDGVHYSELLPNEDLQDYFETSYDKTQFIALTQNQKHAIEEQILENFSHYLMEDIDN